MGNSFVNLFLTRLRMLCAFTFRYVSFILKIIVPLGVVVLVIVVFFMTGYFKNPGPLQYDTTVVVPEGSSLTSISNLLASNNIISYPDAFKVMVRITDAGRLMKAGQYSFASGVTPMQVFEKISKGDVVVHKITIPEGLMVSQILQLIADAKYMTGEVPEGVLEGSLLPETYDYYYGDSREKLVQRMQKSMRDFLSEAWEERVDGLPFKTKYDALVFASIVEKETGVASERDRVAAVFVNRLRKNMRLQTDPTVIYAVTKGKYVLDRPLRKSDLAMASPYNTYKNYGLPPTPISNPGKASILATLNPAVSEEYYFVADGTGGHKFSSTLREHNNNVIKWREINRKKKGL